MNILKNFYASSLIIFLLIGLPYLTAAQEDTIKKRSFDEYLLTRKGMFGKLAKVLMTDTSKENDETIVQRNDIRFQKYSGKIIRHILIRRLDFGIPMNDTDKHVTTFLTRISNKVHHKTTARVIENNLFFKEHDTIQPFLLADNERYLRNLPYLRDAKINVIRLQRIPDSVDIIIHTKDVLSLGAEVSSVDINNTDVAFTEENLAGMGDKVTIKTLYDRTRTKNFGYGLEYTRRNIGGTFIDGYAGYDNFNKTIYGNKEETSYYIGLIRPLVNSYIRWTYGLEISRHQTQNLYSGDSVYTFDKRYNYNNFDIWARLNVNAAFLNKYLPGQRLRTLAGLRLLSQNFDVLPLRYNNIYDPRFADVTGVLGSFLLLSQDFYKVQYIYGFGRNEDVPAGLAIEVTPGYIRKNNENRPYLGMKFERYYFTAKQRYLDFTLRTEASLYRRKLEDITLFGNIDFFNRLKNIGQWKQRTFLSAGYARQINSVLDPPLLLESKYGLPEFRNGYTGGNTRATFKCESVFYSPLSIASFRFAPFLFYNASYFTPINNITNKNTWYSSVGAGLRTRNESLIFGTLEVRGYYFPRKNYNSQGFKIEINSNLKYKYDPQLAGRPDFIQVN